MQIPGLRQILVFVYRFWLGLREVGAYTWRVMRWWVSSRETTNFTYALSADSERYLVHFIANHTQQSTAQIKAYIEELKNDEVLRSHIRAGIWQSGQSYKADLDIQYSKRLGWYALVRALKPKTVVETGLDKGLGSVVLCAALKRNAEEGNAGYYYGTDINPKAGYLLKGDYARFGEVLYGDSIASLKELAPRIDMFINDSDHSASYEAEEYRVIAGKLSPDALIVGDNCDATDALCAFAEATGRRFDYWREEPKHHWFPGGGIGVAYFVR